jgi:hypothetical protein
MPSAPESSPTPQGPRHSISLDMYQHIFDCGGPLACSTHQIFQLCRQRYLQTSHADSAVLAMCPSGLLPDPPWMVCQVILIAKVLPIPSLIPPVPGTTPTRLPQSASFSPQSSRAAHRPSSAHLPCLWPGMSSCFPILIRSVALTGLAVNAA